MTTLREAAQRTLDTFDSDHISMYAAFLALKESVRDLRAALAAPEPDAEPVAWQLMSHNGPASWIRMNPPIDNVEEWRPLYAHPAPAQTPMPAALALVNKQAEDKSLWFIPRHITEDVLQRALRELHRAVEEAPAQTPMSEDQK